MKENVSKAIAKVVGGIEQEQIKELLETPPDSSMGDMALPCFAQTAPKSIHLDLLFLTSSATRIMFRTITNPTTNPFFLSDYF